MPTRSSSRDGPPPPVVKVTRYEQVSSLLITAIAGLVTAVVLLSAAWYALRAPREPVAVPVELVELTGGVEDGVVGETLRVDSPFEETQDATPAEVAAGQTEVSEALDSVLGVADDA